jgi:hypothetical protein
MACYTFTMVTPKHESYTAPAERDKAIHWYVYTSDPGVRGCMVTKQTLSTLYSCQDDTAVNTVNNNYTVDTN